jgi:hypothetical protein
VTDVNKASKNKKKVLMLAYTKEDVINSLPLIREFKKNGSAVTVIGLDFYSWIELRRRSVRYKTPADYFDKEKCEKIDLEAIRLARCWYEPIEYEITYHGMCLGEMAEYDFAHLFIDALRSIEIAKSLIDLEKPNEICLPKNVPNLRANTVRYESLSKVLTCLAKSKRIHVSYINPNFGYRNVKNKATSFIENIAIRTLNGIKRLKLKNMYSEYKNKIVFVDVPPEIFLPIKNELEKNQRNIAINISAFKALNRGKTLDSKFTELVEIWRDLKNNQKFGNNMIYSNISLIEILSERFSRFFSDESLMLINYIEGTEKFIRTLQPHVAVIMEDISPLCRVIIRVFKISGVPTLVIQHGAVAGDMKGFHVMPVEADKQAVWGSISKEWATERGRSPGTQVITGNPRYDLIITLNNKSEKEKLVVYDKLGLSRRKGIVVIATSWYQAIASCYTPEEDEEFISKALEAMKEFPDKQVVVKLHPAYHRMDNEITSAIRDELQIDDVFITSHFLWELLSICDLLITQSSTVGLEAMLLDKPVITFSSIEALDLNPYVATGSVIEVHKEEDLVPAIKDALYNKDVQRRLADARKRFVYECAYLQDGKASQRVANLIEQMIEESKMNSCVVASRK